MKDLPPIILMLLVSFTALDVMNAASSDYTLSIYGNANMDSVIDDSDKDYLSDIISGSREPTALADANQDHKIDSEDIELVDKIINYQPANITIIDSSNRTVSFNIPVQSIAGLHTSPCREFMMLGIEDRVVGVTSYVFDDPELYSRLMNKTDIGTIYEPNYEAIAKVKPEILIMSVGSSYMDPVLDVVNPMGIKLIGLNLHTTPDTYNKELAMLGYITGESQRAEDFLNWRQKTLNLISERTSGLSNEEKLRVFSCGLSSILKGDTEVSPGLSGKYQIISEAGALNIADGIASGSKVDGEWILKQDPDAIILDSYYTKDGFGYTVKNETLAFESLKAALTSKLLNKTRAAQEGHVYILGYYGTTSGGQDPIGAAYLAKRFYPELFEDLDPKDIQKEYFEDWFKMPYSGVWAYP